jgi:predicted DNA-binding protein YlxM (UPF0122 family)
LTDDFFDDRISLSSLFVDGAATAATVVFGRKRRALAAKMKKPNAGNARRNGIGGVPELARRSLLFDYYGQLLSERQRNVYGLYHEENYSLGEIGDLCGISRQGAHEALKKAESAIARYEEKLGLIAKHEAYLNALKKIDLTAAKLMEDEAVAGMDGKKDAARIKRLLGSIRREVRELDF